MTSPHPTQTVRGADLVQPTRYLFSRAVENKAINLQRQGKTLSEIAEELDCRREAIVNLLYWEVVRDVV